MTYSYLTFPHLAFIVCQFPYNLYSHGILLRSDAFPSRPQRRLFLSNEIIKRLPVHFTQNVRNKSYVGFVLKRELVKGGMRMKEIVKTKRGEKIEYEILLDEYVFRVDHVVTQTEK